MKKKEVKKKPPGSNLVHSSSLAFVHQRENSPHFTVKFLDVGENATSIDHVDTFLNANHA